MATKQEVLTSYDGSVNFLGENVRRYIGEILWIEPKSEILQQYGYDGFIIDYKKSISDKSNIYKCCDGVGSKYNELAGKYFKVIDVIEHPEKDTPKGKIMYGGIYYLKLQEKESNDILFYEYHSKYESSFPFVAVKFYEKQKGDYLGKEYVFADKYLEEIKDVYTGLPITQKTEQKWKCIDLIIEEEFFNYLYILENNKGEKIGMNQSVLKEKWTGVFYVSEVEKYKKKFGVENFNTIFKGKVKIGMTKEMCKLSWGEPTDVNKTAVAGKQTEQWVYGNGNYLYFENNILTAIQN
ncbi:MAG: hypothetical protein WCY89_05015 [Flavobacteriaceae bacterium]